MIDHSSESYWLSRKSPSYAFFVVPLLPEHAVPTLPVSDVERVLFNPTCIRQAVDGRSLTAIEKTPAQEQRPEAEQVQVAPLPFTLHAHAGVWWVVPSIPRSVFHRG